MVEQSRDTRSRILIDVTSDFACPWCWVGYKRLEAGIQQAGVAVDLRFHPYMIDMQTQAGGEPFRDYCARRWGGDGWVGPMKRDGARDGAAFAEWGRENPASVWANTLHPHRLMHYVEKFYGSSAASRLKQRLFEEYYEKGVNISLVPELVRVGASFLQAETTGKEGTSSPDTVQALEAELREYLNSSAGEAEVLQEDRRAKREGVSGVPFFDVECVSRGFSGAREPEFWADLLSSVRDHKSKAGKK
ncbi:unnamed protein product [Amoebophrya sp. A25]|nr:unnamed protein product [Amoebophrya sp. A25]|eukprot:GSA25T00001895001.1